MTRVKNRSPRQWSRGISLTNLERDMLDESAPYFMPDILLMVRPITWHKDIAVLNDTPDPNHPSISSYVWANTAFRKAY